MTLEDRIRTSVDARVSELRASVEHEVRALADDLVRVATADRDEALLAARQAALAESRAEIDRTVEEAESRARVHLDEVVARVRDAESEKLTRLLESVRALDRASSLGEVLDALGDASALEAARAAVLVVRQERLLGWKLSGFGVRDSQPKSTELGLNESGVIRVAVGMARPTLTRDGDTNIDSPSFAELGVDHLGYAVPVIVGGRAVAVVYADTGGRDPQGHTVSRRWWEVIELLARHAARCLEALTVQKVATAASPRFWGTAAQTVTRGAAAAPQTNVASRASISATGPDAAAGVRA